MIPIMNSGPDMGVSLVDSCGSSYRVCVSGVVVEVVCLVSGEDCVGNVGEFWYVSLDLFEDVGAVHGVESIGNVN